MTSLNCLIKQTDCGRTTAEPICSKCGLDERVRYIGEDAALLAKSQAEARYWKNRAESVEREALARSKADEVKRQAEKEYQEAQVSKNHTDKIKLAELERHKSAELNANKDRQIAETIKATDRAELERLTKLKIEKERHKEHARKATETIARLAFERLLLNFQKEHETGLKAEKERQEAHANKLAETAKREAIERAELERRKSE